MITIPTCDLVGVIADAAIFADPDVEAPIVHAVRLEWDGDMLHAQATDRYTVGWSRWSADDAPADNKDALLPKWGGGDAPWAILLTLEDAQDIIKNFKLGAKQGYTPLNVDYVDDRLRVKRMQMPGLSKLEQEVDGIEFSDFPDIPTLLAGWSMPTPIDGIAFNPKKLAEFAKVRPRGPMHMTFTAPTRPVHITIGKRFEGAVMPVRESEPEGGSHE